MLVRNNKKKDISLNFFWILFDKTKQLMKKSSDKHFSHEKTNQLILMISIIWIIQSKGYLNSDSDYLITHFHQIHSNIKHPQKKDNHDFSNFLAFLTNKIFNSGIIEKKTEDFFANGDLLKNLPIFGRKILFDNKGNLWNPCIDIHFSDEVYYDEKYVNIIPNLKSIELFRKSTPITLPILNMFLIYEKFIQKIDLELINNIFELKISKNIKSKTGTYYTPDYICNFISRNALYNQLIYKKKVIRSPNISKDKRKDIGVSFEYLKEKFLYLDKKEKKIWLEEFIKQLNSLKIIDPAIGSGQFILNIIEHIKELYRFVWNQVKLNNFPKLFEIEIRDNYGKQKKIDLMNSNSYDMVFFYLKVYIVIPSMIYGVDINPISVIFTKLRLLLDIIDNTPFTMESEYSLKNIEFNIKSGNSLIGLLAQKDIKYQISSDKTNKIDYFTRYIKPINNKIMQISKSLLKFENIFTEFSLIDLISRNNDFFHYSLNNEQDILDFYNNLSFFLIIIRKLNQLLKNIVESDEIFLQYELLVEDINNLTNIIYVEINNNTKNDNKIHYFHWFIEFPEVFIEKSSKIIPEFLSPERNSGFDIIIGNPPYGNLLNSNEKSHIFPCYSYPNEISSAFIERSIQLNNIGGEIDFINSYVICFSKDLSNTRNKMVQHYSQIYFSIFDRDKCRLFKDMTQSVSIIQILFKKKRNEDQDKQKLKISSIYTTKMYRTFPKFSNLTFQRANEFLLSKTIHDNFNEKHRLPKLGDKITIDILNKLKIISESLIYQKSSIKQIGDLISSPIIIRNIEEYEKKITSNLINNEDIIWIRISGNYWYNAWNNIPYYGTQIAFCKLLFPISGLKEYLLILINSSFYYLWFRIYSDGRHMNSDILKSLVLYEDFQQKISLFESFYKILANYLMKALFFNFDSKHNRFNTSNIKVLIDVCDIFIGYTYNLSKEEINYIRSYDHEIRGKIQLAKELDNKIIQIINNIQLNGMQKKNLSEFEEILLFLLEEIKKKSNNS